MSSERRVYFIPRVRRARRRASVAKIVPFRRRHARVPVRVPPPRVAYIMSRFPKITETFILFEILAVEKLGLPVEVFPLLRERQGVVHPEAVRVVERAHFHPFVSLRIAWAHLYFLGTRPLPYLRMLIEVLVGTAPSANFFLGALGILPKTVRFAYEMQRLGVTHVHAHFATHPALAALVIHRLTGIPFSFTAHGSDLHVDRTMLGRKVKASAFTVAISEFNKGVVLEECGEELQGKVRVVHCGVDPSVFKRPTHRADPVDSERTALRLLCVASYEEVKGHRYLIDACAQLRERGIDFELDLIGEGPCRTDVERRIADADLGTRVHIHGAQPRDVVRRMMSEADVMCLPSVPTAQGKREGIPVVLMEAMASSLPVVSSRLSGIPELVEDGASGILVEPRDAAALAHAIERLAHDPDLRADMGAAGRACIEARFNLQSNAAQLAAMFAAHEDAGRDDLTRFVGSLGSLLTSTRDHIKRFASDTRGGDPACST